MTTATTSTTCAWQLGSVRMYSSYHPLFTSSYHSTYRYGFDLDPGCRLNRSSSDVLPVDLRLALPWATLGSSRALWYAPGSMSFSGSSQSTSSSGNCTSSSELPFRYVVGQIYQGSWSGSLETGSTYTFVP